MNLWPNGEKPMTIMEAMKWAEIGLEQSGRPDATVDAKLLMLYVLKWNSTKLLLDRHQLLSEEVFAIYKRYVEMRQTGKPLQYITGEQEFMGLNFKVNEHVLIPRQDTETLIEKVLEKLPIEKPLTGIDIGTGTGCIGITLAVMRPLLEMILVDISSEALEVAKYNVSQHTHERVSICQSDLLTQYKGDKVDFIISNPPYIAAKDMVDLMVEVKDYEPHIALTDDGDGLYFYREISKQAKNYLKPNGLLAYEIGYDQGKAVTTLLEQEGYCQIECHKDLAGQDRVIIARYT